MIDRHEFLQFEYRYGKVRVVCYCGVKTRLYVSEGTATTEHRRHQDRELGHKRVTGGMGT
jgi:hypothetical protein